MMGIADAFQDAAIALNGARRGDVVCEAGDEDTLHSERSACLLEHLAQSPARQSTATRGRSDAVADVADVVVELVPQDDSPEDLAALHDPSGRAMSRGRARGPDRMGQPSTNAACSPVVGRTNSGTWQR